jgi:Icc-related predicted phosphoesterase
LTPSFASNLEGLLDANKIELWIHGHTHDSFDYEIYDKRVVCNPRGYSPHELNRDFRPDWVVEV